MDGGFRYRSCCFRYHSRCSRFIPVVPVIPSVDPFSLPLYPLSIPLFPLLLPLFPLPLPLFPLSLPLLPLQLPYELLLPLPSLSHLHDPFPRFFLPSPSLCRCLDDRIERIRAAGHFTGVAVDFWVSVERETKALGSG